MKRNLILCSIIIIIGIISIVLILYFGINRITSTQESTQESTENPIKDAPNAYYLEEDSYNPGTYSMFRGGNRITTIPCTNAAAKAVTGDYYYRDPVTLEPVKGTIKCITPDLASPNNIVFIATDQNSDPQPNGGKNLCPNPPEEESEIRRVYSIVVGNAFPGSNLVKQGAISCVQNPPGTGTIPKVCLDGNCTDSTWDNMYEKHDNGWCSPSTSINDYVYCGADTDKCVSKAKQDCKNKSNCIGFTMDRWPANNQKYMLKSQILGTVSADTSGALYSDCYQRRKNNINTSIKCTDLCNCPNINHLTDLPLNMDGLVVKLCMNIGGSQHWLKVDYGVFSVSPSYSDATDIYMHGSKNNFVLAFDSWRSPPDPNCNSAGQCYWKPVHAVINNPSGTGDELLGYLEVDCGIHWDTTDTLKEYNNISTYSFFIDPDAYIGGVLTCRFNGSTVPVGGIRPDNIGIVQTPNYAFNAWCRAVPGTKPSTLGTTTGCY